MQPDPQHIQELRERLRRRLEMLELQEASKGVSTPPDVLTEIEDIRARLAQFDQQDQPTDMAVAAPPNNNTPVSRAEFLELVALVSRMWIVQMLSVVGVVLGLVSFIMALALFIMSR